MFTAKYKIKNIPSLRFGLNNAMEPSEINDAEMAECENFSVDETSMITAYGYIASDANPLAGPYYAIFEFKKSNGDAVLIRQRQDKLEYSSNVGTFFGTGWTECTLPQAGSPAENIALTQTTPTFAVLNDTILFSNGTDSVMSSTDGITWAVPTCGSPAEELPKAHYLICNGYNRVIFARTDASPSVIWWSDINDPTTVDTASYQYIAPNDGGRITGIGRAPTGALILFKDQAVYSIDDITLGMTAVNYIGAMKLSNHHTVCTTEDSILCMGWDGIYEISSAGIKHVSGRIKTKDENLIFTSTLFRAIYFKNDYHVAMPDKDVSQSYNSQEYVLSKNLRRDDEVQPYVITRNRRYFGCYGHVDHFIDSTGYRQGAIFVGDSQGATGSPPSGGTLFSWINAYRQSGFTQGLNGAAQSTYFATKYFTENVAFFVKRFKKLFVMLKVENDTSVTLSYRFLPYGAWTTDSQQTVTVADLELDYGDESDGNFSEGYGFYLRETSEIFDDIEQSGPSRGIQFKIATNQVNDAYILSLAYKYLVKINFR